MFFRHLNAECPFIDETALVQDFTRNKHMGKFWSYPLLYAICLLGARISRDPQVSATVDPLKRCVHKLLSFKRLQSPHITIVQAFFCLALFEFGAGNNSKGWLLSGAYSRSWVKNSTDHFRNGCPYAPGHGTSSRPTIPGSGRLKHQPRPGLTDAEKGLLGLLCDRQVSIIYRRRIAVLC